MDAGADQENLSWPAPAALRAPFADLPFPAAIAGFFHFRCDASLITEYRPYATSPLVLNCDFDPMCNITVLTEIQYRLVVFHSELHL